MNDLFRRPITYIVGVLLAFALATYIAGEIVETVVITTYDDDGAAYSAKVWVVDYDGAVWVRVANPERAWYQRITGHPRMELERAGKLYHVEAHPDPSLEGRRKLDQAFRSKYGLTDWWYGVLLRNNAVPIRLDVIEGP
jgi:hypothetical protein